MKGIVKELELAEIDSYSEHILGLLCFILPLKTGVIVLQERFVLLTMLM